MNARAAILALAGLLTILPSLGAQEPGRRLATYDLSRFLGYTQTGEGRWIPSPPTLRGDGYRGVDPEWDHYGSGGAIAFSEDSPYFPERSDGLSPRFVSEAIRHFVAPDSWNNTRNRLGGSGRPLVVCQSPAVLAEIEELLDTVARHATRRVVLDVAMVPPGVLARIAPEWTRPGASPWLPGETLDEAVATAGKRGRWISVPVTPGELAIVSPSTLSLHILDFHVGCTGVVPVPVLRPEQVPRGAFLSARVLESPSGSWFRLDLVAGVSRLGERPAFAKLELGSIDLVQESQRRVATCVTVPRGDTVVVGSCELPAPPPGRESEGLPAPFVVLARVSAPAVAEVPEKAAEGRLRAIDLGLLALEPTGHQFLVSSERDEGGEFELDLGVEESTEIGEAGKRLLEEALRASTTGDATQDRAAFHRGATLLVRGSETIDAGKLRRELDRGARSAAPLLSVDLWRGAASREEVEALGGSGVALGDEWLERVATRPGLRTRIAAISGVPVALASVTARNYLADFEKVSGGTGYCIFEIGDPAVRRAGAGLVANVTATLVPGTSWVQLEVDAEAAGQPRFGRTARVRDTGALGASRTVHVAEGRDAGEVTSTGSWVELELPEEATEGWRHLVTAPLGRPVLLSSFPAPGQPGQVRVLVAVIHAFR